MGFFIPLYNLPDRYVALLLKEIKAAKQEFFYNRGIPKDKVTHRPIRPNEINTTFTEDNRIYETTTVGTTFERILGATLDITVPPGQVYMFFGWICVIPATGGLDAKAVVRIKVTTVIRNEAVPVVINVMENNAILMLEQMVVASENKKVKLEVKSPTALGQKAIIYPLGIVIGDPEELDVS